MHKCSAVLQTLICQIWGSSALRCMCCSARLLNAAVNDFQVDVSGMDLSAKLELGQLAAMLPEGAKLLAKDMKQPVVKIGGRGSR